MFKDSDYDYVETLYVCSEVAGYHLNFDLAQEAPLFGPTKGRGLIYAVGYNSWRQRKAIGMLWYSTKDPAYRCWISMMSRVYYNRKPAYAGCSVCIKWHDYQEFALWYHLQPYAGHSDTELDKDALDKHNLVYCPEKCALVPRIINRIFRNTRLVRGDLPLGVTESSDKKRVEARISMFGRTHYLGRFRTVMEASNAHRIRHKAYCEELANMYEGRVDERVIARLRHYMRHIND